jgi:hypothetical protein
MINYRKLFMLEFIFKGIKIDAFKYLAQPFSPTI